MSESKLESKNLPTVSNARELKIITHHKYFTASFIEILNIIQNKSQEIQLEKLDITDKTNMKLFKGHTKLRSVCDDLKSGFLNDNEYDQGRIIKKIYKVLTQQMDKFYPNPSKELFVQKNQEGAIITIIPGLDVSLVINMMNDQEMNNLWDYMYVMYISAVSLISLTNEHKKGKVFEIIPQMRERVVKSGVLHRGDKMMNPFFGLMSEASESAYNVETMFSSVDEMQSPNGDMMDELLKMSGVEKLVDVEQLNSQLKNVKQEDIDEATRSITKLLGAEGDKDVTEVCNTLVGGIVEDLKENSNKGVQGMFETAKKVSEKYGKNIARDKMGKTVDKLASFMKDGENNLKNMKDEKGNPIGEKIMSSLKGPLEMAQQFEKGANGMPNFANMASLFQQVSGAVNNIKNEPTTTDQKNNSKRDIPKKTKEPLKVRPTNPLPNNIVPK